MQGPLKSIIAGALSGTATYFASMSALGYTNAVAMPSWIPLAVWDAVVVFGLGAALVALLIHLAVLLVARAHASWSIVPFAAVTLLAMGLSGHLAYGTKTIAAWAVGVVLASLTYHLLRPGNSLKPTPLRGAA